MGRGRRCGCGWQRGWWPGGAGLGGRLTVYGIACGWVRFGGGLIITVYGIAYRVVWFGGRRGVGWRLFDWAVAQAEQPGGELALQRGVAGPVDAMRRGGRGLGGG